MLSNSKQSVSEKCAHCGCELDRIIEGLDEIAYCKNCGCVPSVCNDINSLGSGHNRFEASFSPHSEITNNRARHQEDKENQTLVMHRTIPQLWLDHSRATDQTEENFALVLSEVTRIIVALSLPKSTAERAAEICRRAFEKILTRGQSIQTLAASAVYIAAKEITVDEVVACSSIQKSDIIHCSRKLQRKLGLKFQPLSPLAHASRILQLLGFPEQNRILDITYDMLQSTENSEFTQGKNPATLAAAAIYIAADAVGRPITQRELSRVSCVTEASIRNRCRDFKHHWHKHR